jgi:DUF1680 family protein
MKTRQTAPEPLPARDGSVTATPRTDAVLAQYIEARAWMLEKLAKELEAELEQAKRAIRHCQLFLSGKGYRTSRVAELKDIEGELTAVLSSQNDALSKTHEV